MQESILVVKVILFQIQSMLNSRVVATKCRNVLEPVGISWKFVAMFATSSKKFWLFE